jgi:predicted nucleotidyltransferase
MRKKYSRHWEYQEIIMKKKEEIISILKEKRSDIIQKYHITRIGIFGSVIRDEAGPGSDIDILVDFNDDASLLDHSGLKIYLEKIFGQPVDVVPERTIRAELRTPILSEVVYI